MDDHVKKLMEAETSANKIVEKAEEQRQIQLFIGRKNKLESARFEAKAEIEKYRQDEEKKYQDAIAKVRK